MAWRVDGTHGRWLSWSNGAWAADPSTAAEVEYIQHSGEHVPLTPTGPMWPVAAPIDELSAYAVALFVIGPHTVAGTPPSLPVHQPERDRAY